MSNIEWIRSNYDVPARLGGRVEYTGDRAGNPQLGTIKGGNGPHLMILLDGSRCAMPFHPTWKLRYLDPSEK